MAKRDVYIAIMVAAAKGQALTLSADELFDLSRDDAISTRAVNGLSEAEAEAMGGNLDAWAKISPRRKRTAANASTGY